MPIVAISPFTGSVNETFDEFNTNMAVQSLSVFGGVGQLQNLSPGGAIKVEFSSSLSGDLVTPMNDMMAGQLGIGQWLFSTPVTRFGGWWENNSGADDAVVQFYSESGTLIGTMNADTNYASQHWTWNGWQFDVPVSKIVVTGNGIVHGFLWYANMQIDTVPSPAGGALLLLAALRYSRKRKTSR